MKNWVRNNLCTREVIIGIVLLGKTNIDLGESVMNKIKLLEASAAYAEKILEYRAEFPAERMRVTYDPSRIPGMDYLENYENVFEWLQFCEDMPRSSLGLIYRKQKNLGLIKCELFAVI